MEETLFIIFLVVAIIFILVGFFQAQHFFLVVGGCLLVLLGGMIAIGLQYQTGNTVNMVNSSFYNVTKIYSTYDHTYTLGTGVVISFKFVWAVIFILLGLANVFVGVFASYQKKKDSTLGDDE